MTSTDEERTLDPELKRLIRKFAAGAATVETELPSRADWRRLYDVIIYAHRNGYDWHVDTEIMVELDELGFAKSMLLDVGMIVGQGIRLLKRFEDISEAARSGSMTTD